MYNISSLSTCSNTIIEILNVIASYALIIVTCIGVKGLYNIRKQQKEARYGFYLNLITHIDLLTSYLTLGDDNRYPSWLEVLGMSSANRTDDAYTVSLTIAREVAKVSKKFLQFLGTAVNQVPPSKDKESWNKNFKILRKHLIAFSIWEEVGNSDSAWAKENCQKSYDELIGAVKRIKKSIEGKCR